MLLPLLAGCHGSRGLREFAGPEEFDTNRDYEITFWAKNDTNKTQTQIYQKATFCTRNHSYFQRKLRVEPEQLSILGDLHVHHQYAIDYRTILVDPEQ